MTDSTNDLGSARPEGEDEQKPTGAEVGMTDDGSTFEPEEDPEGHAD